MVADVGVDGRQVRTETGGGGDLGVSGSLAGHNEGVKGSCANA